MAKIASEYDIFVYNVLYLTNCYLICHKNDNYKLIIAHDE